MLTALQRIRMMTSQENDNIKIFHWRTESWVLFWDMVNLFSFGYHVIDRAYASTDCTGGVGETIKRKGGVSQACLAKSTSFTLDIHNMVN